jgi:carbon storage regulator
MLVLTRRVGEEIVIGDMVRVTVVDVKNQRVKVGIKAPSHVTVHRHEVHQQLQGLHDCPGDAEENENGV